MARYGCIYTLANKMRYTRSKILIVNQAFHWTVIKFTVDGSIANGYRIGDVKLVTLIYMKNGKQRDFLMYKSSVCGIYVSCKGSIKLIYTNYTNEKSYPITFRPNYVYPFGYARIANKLEPVFAEDLSFYSKAYKLCVVLANHQNL